MKQYYKNYFTNKTKIFKKIENNKKVIEKNMWKYFFNDNEIKLDDILLWLTGWDFDDKSLNKACKNIFETKNNCVKELLKCIK